MDIKINDKIKLKTFNKTSKRPTKCDEKENYWKLIGYTGKVVQDSKQGSIFADFSGEKRVLIQFDKNIKSLNLHCHNSIENSLWILVADLEILR